ncbi:MAG: nucleotidyltransferase domain-containing protein [Lachnospiraceae bacterium]|nr:nucleotidyltransferase domain-containing protein [Lachnospiraceae bacterium]MCD8130868.1 nucleotidyltransferase domain-containing protein [Lachnospiraceae bacterium]
MVYTVDEIRNRVTPVAQKYQLKAVYLFGSYARNEATENSDVDILVDRQGSVIHGMFEMGGLYNDLKESMGKEIDLVTTQTLEQKSTLERTPWFVDNLKAEMVKLYE